MKKRTIVLYLILGLGAVVMASAVSAPAEVIDNLDFFSDLEMISNLEILESEPAVAVSSGPAAALPEVSTGTVTVSTFTAEEL